MSFDCSSLSALEVPVVLINSRVHQLYQDVCNICYKVKIIPFSLVPSVLAAFEKRTLPDGERAVRSEHGGLKKWKDR